MALTPWCAGKNVMDLFEEVKAKHHTDRIGDAHIAVCFTDTKPFIKDRFNFGKVMKFSPLAKLWHSHEKYDFLIMLCADAWHSILTEFQREAYADLQLTRCRVDYEPEYATDNKGKKHVIKDEWGRIQYSSTVKVDEEGNIKYKVVPLDIHVLTENVIRYGSWCEEILTFRDAISNSAVTLPNVPEVEQQTTAQLLTEAEKTAAEDSVLD